MSHSNKSVINLSDLVHVAEGRQQIVFEHPTDPTSVIKLPKPEKNDGRGNLLKKRRGDRFRRATAYRSFLREFQEFVELKARRPEVGAILPLCEIRGIVQTDLGMGLVYERITNPDGTLAPQLGQLIDQGRIGDQQLTEIEAHFSELMDNHVVLCHFNLENILYQTLEDGSGRFVWVDSIGSRQLIPTRRWFRELNDRKLRKIRDKCIEAMQLGLSNDTGANAGKQTQ